MMNLSCLMCISSADEFVGVIQSSAATNNNAVWCLASNKAETLIAVSTSRHVAFLITVWHPWMLQM